jgi:hypothetical protein
MRSQVMANTILKRSYSEHGVNDFKETKVRTIKAAEAVKVEESLEDSLFGRGETAIDYREPANFFYYIRKLAHEKG